MEFFFFTGWDGKVLRHSAAKSCWHRNRGGQSMGGQNQAGLTGLVGVVRLAAPWPMTAHGRRSYSAMELRLHDDWCVEDVRLTETTL